MQKPVTSIGYSYFIFCISFSADFRQFIRDLVGSNRQCELCTFSIQPKISADPIIPDELNPQALNRYSYVYNNPISNVDLTGHQPEASAPDEWAPWPYQNGAILMPTEYIKGYVFSDPPLVRTASISPFEQQAREKYEFRYREAMRTGKEVPQNELRGATWSEILDMTFDWLFQGSTAFREFGPGSPQVQDLKDAPGVEKARAFFLAKNAQSIQEGKPLEPVINFKGDFPWYKSPIQAGLDPTEQFVGGFRVDIYPGANNKIRFVLFNVTSRESGLYHLPIRSPNRDESWWGGNQTQIYTWMEDLPLR